MRQFIRQPRGSGTHAGVSNMRGLAGVWSDVTQTQAPAAVSDERYIAWSPGVAVPSLQYPSEAVGGSFFGLSSGNGDTAPAKFSFCAGI